jgi:predicted permease
MDATLETVGNPLPWNSETIALFLPAGIAFGLVLLICCVNVANVMLARGIARQREIGVRLALGAGRGRLIRQLFTESMLLALPAAGLGLWLSRVTLDAGVRIVIGTVPPDIAAMLRFVPMEPDLRVFGFILLAALASAIVFGLAPAIQATRPNLVQASRGDFDTDFGSGRARNLLIVAEVAACALLLIVTGVLLRGADRATNTDPVIHTAGSLQLTINDSDRVETVRRLRAVPGVREVAAMEPTVVDGIYPSVAVKVPGSARITRVYSSYVDSAYFQVSGVAIRRGRKFTGAETMDTTPVVIVSEAAAEFFWPKMNPIGQMLELANPAPKGSRLARLRMARVVGVAQNVPPGWIGIDRRSPAIYYPATAESNGMHLLVHGDDARALKERIDRALTDANPRSIHQINTLDDYLAIQVWPFKAFSWLATGIGVIALILTVIGIYGVLSYVVAQRTREIGIRMALGGGMDSVVGLIMRQVGRKAALGVAIGVLLALGVSKLLSSVLVVVDSFDVVGYGLGIGVVLCGALVAALAPARKASRVNPAIALRAE